MSGDKKPDIRQLSKEELLNWFHSQDEKPFRAQQVYEWLWHKGVRSFSSMTNLNVPLRNLLADSFTFDVLEPGPFAESKDGTRKVIFRSADGKAIEGVLIPSQGRTTACISSQAGCPLGCTFCATGKLGFKRNLSSGEIFDQVMFLNQLSVEKHGTSLSNIVYMGMGEPLLNYEQVIGSLDRITAPDGLGMSPQRITLSSVGIPKMIRQLADDRVKVHFALSLHAATNEKRDKIIPVNRKYPLEMITEALKYYHKTTGKRITIEYVMLGGFNDTERDASDLARFCKSFPVKVNLIEYNPGGSELFERSSENRVKQFADTLEKKNMVVNIRKSRGKDIDAACGQLALKTQEPVARI